MLSRNQLKVGEGERDNDQGEIGAEVLLLRVKSSFLERERRHKDNQQRLMITRLRNIQVGRGQYLYRMDGSGEQRLKAQTKKEIIGARLQSRKWQTMREDNEQWTKTD